jgi:hydrogenase maturation protease
MSCFIMIHILLIGYGNPLREDDGIGWRVVEELANGQWSMVNPQFVAVHQLLPELAEPISQADLVIFVDAAVEGEPGEIRRVDLTPQAERPGAFSHQVGPAGLLESARVLYGRYPPATLFTITAAQMGYGEELSPTVAAALPHLLRQIHARIQEY